MSLWRRASHDIVYEVRWKKSAKLKLMADIPDVLAVEVVNFLAGPVAKDPYGEGTRLQFPFSYQLAVKYKRRCRIVFQVDDEKQVITVDAVALLP